MNTIEISSLPDASGEFSLIKSVKVFESQFDKSAGTSNALLLLTEEKKDVAEAVLHATIDIANLPSTFDVNENDLFIEKGCLKTTLKVIAMRGHFKFRTPRSSKTRYEIVCKISDCPWSLKASVCSASKLWVIRSYDKIHTCYGQNTQIENRQVSSYLISQCVKADLSGSFGKSLTPKCVKEIMRCRYKVNISYYKAWKARTEALAEIRGSYEDSYSHLPLIGDLIKEKNPGSFTDTVVDSKGNFKYFFLALAASMHGWKYCRPVISVDSTFLKGKYYGTLLLATAHDGDNHLFPLVFGIVGSEDDKSWKWFMERVRKAYGVREDLVIISDRKMSIPKAVHEVFPEAKYAVCMQHLWSNVKAKFGKSYIQPMFYRCAKAYTVKEYNYWLNLLSAYKPAIKKYLVEAHPEIWSRAHFQGRRYGLMTTNISESMNAVLNEAREWPVAALVLSWRCLVQKWFNKQRSIIPKMLSGITPHALKVLEEVENNARSVNVLPVNNSQFEVIDGMRHHVVNIATRSCTCCFWQLEDFPCSHAAAAIYRVNLRPIDFVPYYFTKAGFEAVYSHDIVPIVHDGDWSLPHEAVLIKPPVQKRQAGRPKMKRYR